MFHQTELKLFCELRTTGDISTNVQCMKYCRMNVYATSKQSLEVEDSASYTPAYACQWLPNLMPFVESITKSDCFVLLVLPTSMGNFGEACGNFLYCVV